ncbi:LPS export ABC transporter permease LptF [Moraxella sp. FZLJ2107]|uniref:LPS export ABC transporter permease LptF n=1 Tax=unclassified Moraxella TaxID=2685852 RepID=UPI0020C86023|nr:MULTISPECIES: LPS export ABC transporter permease LptF [unclassified Moraxella]UTO04353.1 LPS export ABC transporter permease LptF [Moraxella sp. FZLJ2107]UTO23186.1 LPS export ABC transporter permease LptF [Moraxella sp. FZLJ2109]
MILRRYLTNQVAITTALVVGFLVVMLLGGRLIRYFGMAAEGGLDVGVLFSLIGYNLPFFLELILPLSFFIALMLVFGRMYSDHEMAVINSSGISRGRLARMLSMLVIVMMLIEAAITLFAKPWGMERATNIWTEQSMTQVFDIIQPKQFISSGDYHLYVNEIGARRESLHDVIVVQMPKDKTSAPIAHQELQGDDAAALQNIPENYKSQYDSLIFARSATQVASSDGSIQLDLHQGRRYEVDPLTRRYSQIGFERYRITIATGALPDTEAMRIEGIATPSLIGMITGDISRENVNEAYAELGYRLSLPWMMLLAVMIATPLSYVRPRQGRWLKLVPALFIYIACVMVIISLKDTVSKGKISVAIYPVAIVLMFAFALYLNYHERLMARMRLSRHTSEKLS